MDNIVDYRRSLALSAGGRRRQVVEHVRGELVEVQERLRLLLVVLAVILRFPRVSQLPRRASCLLEAGFVHRGVDIGWPWSAHEAAVGRAHAVVTHLLLRVSTIRRSVHG